MACIDVPGAEAVASGVASLQLTEQIRAHASACLPCAQRLRRAAEAGALTGGPTASTRIEPPAAHPEAAAPAPAAAAAAATAQEHALARGASIDRFLVLDTLGAGGMGVVYAAYDPNLNRKVAIKFLRGTSGDAGAGPRLAREAQAMAQLSHPNVVSVYEVGTYQAQMFVAMELVEGQTLKKWMREKKRSQAEILPAFIAAGRGLAAAHAKELIHRDFKPDNVLVGHDGRVRVTDFGLARHRSDTEGGPLGTVSSDEVSGPTGPTSPSGPSSSSIPHPSGPGPSGPTALDTPLTLTGMVMGTPAYMAPEQHRAEATDARTDQFAFAVALYEALHGERPFKGKGVALKKAVCAGRISPPPRGSHVPAWLRAVLERALRPDPAERFPTLAAMLEALEKDPAVVRRRWLTRGAVGALAAGLVALIGYGVWDRAHPCRNREHKLDGIWDDARREAVQAAFLATHVSYAQTSWNTLRPTLDAYANAWRSGDLAACQLEARQRTRPAGAAAAQCLERRREQFAALTGLFVRADQAVVENALAAVEVLHDPASCTRQEAKAAGTPLDAGEHAVREQVALVRVLRLSGQLGGVGKEARALMARLPSISDPALRAQAEYESAASLVDESVSEAVPALKRSMWDALAAGDDETAFQAAFDLIDTLSNQGHGPEAGALAPLMEAVAQRLGPDPVRAAKLMQTRATLAEQLNNADTLPLQEQAVALNEKAYGKDGWSTSVAVWDLAIVLSRRGEFARALPMFEGCLERDRRLLGDEHPETAWSLQGMGRILLQLRQPARAAEFLNNALRIHQRTLSPNHRLVLADLRYLAEAQNDLGHPAEALELARKVEELCRGDAAQTLTTAEAALQEARALVALGHPEPALALCERLQAAVHQSVGAAPPPASLGAARIADLAGFSGHVLLERHQFAPAQVALEKALTLWSSEQLLPERAQAEFDLARALQGLSRDPDRARGLARSALAVYRGKGPAFQQSADEVSAWLSGPSNP